jgi:hypothetical protein
MPTRVAPDSSSGQSVASPRPERPHTTCARAYSDTSSWRRPQNADGTGYARGSSAAPTSRPSRDWRRSSSSPLSAPVRPPLHTSWPGAPFLLFFLPSLSNSFFIIDKKSRLQQGSRPRAAVAHHPSLRPVVAAPPPADSERVRIIRRTEYSCAPPYIRF